MTDRLTPTDWRELCAELLEDVRYLIDAVCDGEHDPVALQECAEDRDRARALLAQPEPEGLTDQELLMTYQHAVSAKVESIIRSTGTYAGMDDLAAATLAGLRAVVRYARPAIEPVPVSERPWEREGWCDAEGRCWWFRGDSPILNAYWDLSKGDSADPVPPTACLPHHALPVPEQ